MMQNAKDSFYIALRNRMSNLNPARVFTLRSVTRPGIVVEEAEAPFAQLPNDVFVLRWKALTLVPAIAQSLLSMTCEIHYATSGSETNAGLDRGRAMAEMDGELLGMLLPCSAGKFNFAVTPAAALQTRIFWGESTFSSLETERNQLIRVATVPVFAFQEVGEV